MTRIRHRRYSDPALAFPGTIEPGEIAVNTANRQIAVGDAAQASPGVSTPLLAVRIFDVRGKYAVGDHIVQAGILYRCKAPHGPAVFDPTHFEIIAGQDQTSALLTNYLLLTGGTLTGPLMLPAPAPTNNAEAANKKYVDDRVATAVIGGVGAINVASTPAGGLASTNVQDALTELDIEKAPIVSPSFSGTPVAPTPLANDNSSKIATTEFVAGQASSSMPPMDGVAAPGIAINYARGDHVHPSDTTLAPLDSPQFAGVPTVPTAAPGVSSLQVANTKFVLENPPATIADHVVTFIKMAASALATTAEFMSKTTQKILTTDAVWAAAVPVTISDAATVAPDLNVGIDFIWSIGAAGRSIGTPFNLSTKVGQKGMIYLVQGIAGATITTWSGVYKFAGGTKPVLSNTLGAVDVVSYAVKSTTEVECFFARGMA